MADDVLTLLHQDHEEAEALLERFDAIPTGERSAYFGEVTRTLVGHEVAEEFTVYPALRDASDQGEQVAQARLEEQAEAERALSDLEDLDTESEEFAGRFRTLRQDVLDHAEAEESTVFPLLEAATTGEQRRELGERYLASKDAAPTHPHPHGPDTPPANEVVVPVAALFDRARDAVSNRSR